MTESLLCPTCNHSLQCDAGKKQKILLYCWKCADSNRAELAALARTLSDACIAVLKVQQKKPRIEHTEEALMNRLTFAQRNLKTDAIAQKFLTDRGISAETAEAFRLGSGNYYAAHRLVIPYLSGCFSESLTQLRYRRLSQSESKNGKWNCDRVAEIHGRVLFNQPLLQSLDSDEREPLLITESELDAMMLLSLGFKAASVDTANHRLVEEDLMLLRQVKHLILAFDQDETGAKCTAHFKALLPLARVIRWKEPVKDIGELFKLLGHESFELRLNTFLWRISRDAATVSN